MSLEIVESDGAVADLDEIADYIVSNGNPAGAERVLRAVRSAYSRLAANPGIGSPRDYGLAEFRGLRMLPVPRYPVYLIFYHATDTDLIIRRVIHGARDIERVLGADDSG
jgi:toxin ParE1/3/4